MRILITGAAGFIGSHAADYFSRQFLGLADLLTIERFNYASSLDRLAPLRGIIKVVFHDLRAPISDHVADQLGELDYIFHFAAETHVDRSMVEPLPFLESNVIGTYNLLEYARLKQPRLRCFFMISTDEVYGPAPFGVDYPEEAAHRPSNPYSATKAAAEDLAFAWGHSMGVPVIITNTMNNIGEMQHPEKFVPKIIRSLMRGEVITVHGSPDRPGTRKYLYAKDHADALKHLVFHGHLGERYNVVGAEEVSNLDLVRRIEKIMGKTARIQFVDFHNTRPGHDLRYSLDGFKLAGLGWTPPTSVGEALERVVKFAQENPEWV